jgi:hypothetical protein
MMASGDQGMEGGIGDAVIGAARIVAGEALGGDASWRTALAPALPPGAHAGRQGVALRNCQHQSLATLGAVVRGPRPPAPHQAREPGLAARLCVPAGAEQNKQDDRHQEQGQQLGRGHT